MASCYLAGPLDYADLGVDYNWRMSLMVHVSNSLPTDQRPMFYSPNAPFENAKNDVQSMIAINEAAVKACSILVAAVFADKPSWGTPIEIYQAREQGKHVLLWVPDREVPPYLQQGTEHYESLITLASRIVEIVKDNLTVQHKPVMREIAPGVWSAAANNISQNPMPCIEALIPKTPDTGATYDNFSVGIGPETGWPKLATVDTLGKLPEYCLYGLELEPMEEEFLLYENGGICHPYFPGDSGFDVTASEDVCIAPHSIGQIPLGCSSGPLRIAPPPGTWYSIFQRSSLVQSGLLSINTVCDGGYRGDLFMFLMNTTDNERYITKGERVGQIVLFNCIVPRIKYVDSLPESQRGANGFGSTGK